MFRSFLLGLIALSGMTLTACSTTSPRTNAEATPAPAEDRMLRDVAQANGVCIFELDEAVARRNGIYYRKDISFSSDEARVAFTRLNPFYKQLIAQYMGYYQQGMNEGVSNVPRPTDPKLMEMWLRGDGGFVQRIVWGKGAGRKTFVNISHYPGDNHYGMIFQIGAGGIGTPVLAINDGDFYDCKVFAPIRSR